MGAKQMLDLLGGVASIAGLGSAAKDVSDFLRQRLSLEDALVELVEEKFSQQLPRINHLCNDGVARFDGKMFKSRLLSEDFQLTQPEDLEAIVRRFLPPCVSTPGATCGPDTFAPVFDTIAQIAARALWHKIGRLPQVAAEIGLGQGEQLLKGQEQLVAALARAMPILEQLSKFARTVHTAAWNKLEDSAPPAQHQIDRQSYLNPFVLARSEDFNHNYEKLAKLFQNSPDWDAIRMPSVNVFIEGGRGTGKSMLLRRLTAQATVAAARLGNPTLTFDQLQVGYFGVYVKLTRGYYDQFETIRDVAASGADLLAQHELNVEIFDAFVDTLKWLRRSKAFAPPSEWDQVVAALSNLFARAPGARALDDLDGVIKFEQEAINDYYRDRAFGGSAPYLGSAQDTVSFLRRLSRIFRDKLVPSQEVRLFLLVDEFETLLNVQQVAINTVIKMRLPDLTLKVAVRKAGRKTSDTFTPGDPVQDPRDYTPIYVDYQVNDPQYKDLLKGISAKRLTEAGYSEADIGRYLVEQPLDEEVSPDRLDQELLAIWESGNRRSLAPNKEFKEKYSLAAAYRVAVKSHKQKVHSGFDQYCLLSSGIVSSYMELCKYTFYYALSDQLPIATTPAIPPFLQNRAVYTVSARLFHTIDGNVPKVGSGLARLVGDLGAVLRARLLQHPSEPEANRLSLSRLDDESRITFPDAVEVLACGITWSVFHLEGEVSAFRPKNFGGAPNQELMINRIYCPQLGISPRTRWRVPVQLSDIAGLLSKDSRDRTFKRLVKTLGGDGPVQDSFL